jgi:hypothetical protein
MPAPPRNRCRAALQWRADDWAAKYSRENGGAPVGVYIVEGGYEAKPIADGVPPGRSTLVKTVALVPPKKKPVVPVEAKKA